jgi:hypothetical protein
VVAAAAQHSENTRGATPVGGRETHARGRGGSYSARTVARMRCAGRLPPGQHQHTGDTERMNTTHPHTDAGTALPSLKKRPEYSGALNGLSPGRRESGIPFRVSSTDSRRRQTISCAIVPQCHRCRTTDMATHSSIEVKLIGPKITTRYSALFVNHSGTIAEIQRLFFRTRDCRSSNMNDSS